MAALQAQRSAGAATQRSERRSVPAFSGDAMRGIRAPVGRPTAGRAARLASCRSRRATQVRAVVEGPQLRYEPATKARTSSVLLHSARARGGVLRRVEPLGGEAAGGAAGGSLARRGTADAVRQYSWLLEDTKNRAIEDVLILSGDHL
ncbi:putative glucose-1-phosphate adenylyltransferase large subunit, chloroplastic [Tetrabaena socialis]|uniref:Putative glucose-1-phosphate adenylyltransferase large subunit, chloroplastic n=1 Tax=Tetrabaena socialis TaxID=47790 RepID=A0A2J7ZUQ4_9CHLO|nr:putative glucose-1-phosphate adenylyltransferase large subunit, chloroplastic [Tetrabaena socialis]|eukprot:PNH04006.1 putative glucose-1-phosphate adenylyltransferase large subunit, chloroplastic [Tetrabaena socialis]